VRDSRRQFFPPPPPAGFASLIVAGFPDLFAEFCGKKFTLLWGGSRDGFDAGDFHDRCDGHAPTLTLIQDTEGNIFGGFTPVEWESRTRIGNGMNCWKADPRANGFLFSLKNPHNLPARKFALKHEKKDEAVCAGSAWGPHFRDIVVFDDCNQHTRNHSWTFGWCYTNDTDLDRKTFFTGSKYFTVKEIEVFEIHD
jgi:hypothetical protein